MTITDFARPNLAYRVEMLPSVGAVERRVVAIVRSSGPQTTIIYTATTKSADRIAKDLACLRYHGDMGNTERKAVQDEFIRQPCPVIVATNAFGMGIDRPDVRCVIHAMTPGRSRALALAPALTSPCCLPFPALRSLVCAVSPSSRCISRCNLPLPPPAPWGSVVSCASEQRACSRTGEGVKGLRGGGGGGAFEPPYPGRCWESGSRDRTLIKWQSEDQCWLRNRLQSGPNEKNN